jgi:hypothetical protein
MIMYVFSSALFQWSYTAQANAPRAWARAKRLVILVRRYNKARAPHGWVYDKAYMAFHLIVGF